MPPAVSTLLVLAVAIFDGRTGVVLPLCLLRQANDTVSWTPGRLRTDGGA